jgi:phospholipase C
MDRREFLIGAAALGGVAAVGGGAYALLSGDDDAEPASVLANPASECPVDTIVVLMLENRSFDHYYGWLGTDERYLEAGRKRYGKQFTIDARTDLAYPLPDGQLVPTSYLPDDATEVDPYRGCRHLIPGHDWDQARAERDGGFLAAGSGNDEFAVGYFRAEDLPVHARLAERFTVFDGYHASLLGGTFPNRQYLHAAQSNGIKYDPAPLEIGSFQGPTIWDKLAGAGVDAGYYYVDLPILLLWGEQYADRIQSTDRYFEQTATGTLPNVVFIDPGFAPPLQTDDHPRGDIRLGQRFVREVFKAFVESKHWERGAFFLVYDEWGGFFDHVPPPILPDERSSPNDEDNFGQAGFRVPAVLASPYGRHGDVDHRLYDHTSILRFLEWRFLGAPPEGPGAINARWPLTTRDQFANNIGRTLRPSQPDLELHYDADVPVGPYSLGCNETAIEQAEELESSGFTPSPAMADVMAQKYPRPTETPWIDSPALPIPVLPVDPDAPGATTTTTAS